MAEQEDEGSMLRDSGGGGGSFSWFGTGSSRSVDPPRQTASRVLFSANANDVAMEASAAKMRMEAAEKFEEEKNKKCLDFDPKFDEINRQTDDDQLVDEMKIQTMYRMVDDVACSVNRRVTHNKVLYLTNKQAQLIDQDAIGKLIESLDVGEYKFVIKLIPAYGVASQMSISNSEKAGTIDKELYGNFYSTSELDRADERINESQVLLFMKNCVLPLAKQTKALILVCGGNDCFLGAALASIALDEQNRLGKDCPFTVIATVWELQVHSRAVTKDDASSMTGQLARGSRAWAARMPYLNDAINRIFSKNPVVTSNGIVLGRQVPRVEVNPAASRFIVFESIDETSDGSRVVNWNPKSNFENLLLATLAAKVPSIAVQSHKCIMTFAYLSDLISRKIPVLLIDSTERAISMKRNLKKFPSTRLARETHAFPTISKARFERIQGDGNDGITFASRLELFAIAEEMCERKAAVLVRNGIVDSLDTSLVAFLHSVVHLAENAHAGTIAQGGSIPLWARIKDLEKLERDNKDANRALVPPEIVTKAIDYIEMRHAAFHAFSMVQRIENFLRRHDPKLDYLEPEARKQLAHFKEMCVGINRNGGVLQHHSVKPDSWLAIYDLMTSAYVFSGSFHDIEDLKMIMSKVAKIDRLPASNSLEALRLLQDGWDHVEVYHQISDNYKIATKLSYFMILLLGITIVVMAQLQAIIQFESRQVILFLAFSESAVAGYITFMNPALRWQSLRMAALSIETNIWLFRTRAGTYRTTGSTEDRDAEAVLFNALEVIKSSVLEGADLKSTSFYSKVMAQSKHNQNMPPEKAAEHKLRMERQKDNELKMEHSEDLEALKYDDHSTSKWGDNSQPSPSPSPLEIEQGTPSISTQRGYSPVPLSDNNASRSEAGEQLILRRLSRVAEDMDEIVVPIAQVMAWVREKDPEAEEQLNDSHYEPLQPERYIKYRLLPSLDFYKKKIPHCHQTRIVVQVLLIFGSLLSAGFAFFDISVWSATVSVITLALTAYMEFQSTNHKITRYSSTIHSLQELLLSWRRLPQIERNAVENIDRLIVTCEELLTREQQAWKSTSQAVRMLQAKGSEKLE